MSTGSKSDHTMHLGMNNNVLFNGTTFHVQTEDSGVDLPFITTHVFIGGNILATKKTSYEDIITSNNLNEIVRSIMDDQHKKVIVAIKRGRIDKNGPVKRKVEPEPVATEAKTETVGKELPAVPVAPEVAPEAPVAVNTEAGLSSNKQPDREALSEQGAETEEKKEKSFDDLILENLSLDKK